MGVTITDNWTPEGLAFMKKIKELSKLEVAIGYEAGAGTEANGDDICAVAAKNEFGENHVPSRPFMRQSVDNHTGEIESFMQGLAPEIASGADADAILNRAGAFMKSVIQKEIINGGFTPNAPATIKRKKSSRPLIDTGRMRQSVQYKVRPRGSGS